MRYKLTQHEYTTARTLGVLRRTAAGGNVKDAQVGKQCPWEIDIDGCVGEFIVARYLNLFPDMTIFVRSGGCDLVTHNNKTIDVKTTRHKDGRLLSTLKKELSPCDYYVLVVVDNDEGFIAGCATAQELFTEGNMLDLGHGVGYALSQDKLWSIEKI